MIEVLKALEESLADELQVERELLAACEEKRRGLVELDLRGVEQATSREQHLLVALGGTAERRLRRTSDAARLLGLSEPEAFVSRVAQRAGEPFCSRILELSEQVRRTLREVSHRNATNRQLAEQSMAHAKRFFQIVTGQKDEVTYSRRGTGLRPELRKIMIDQVI